MNVQRIVVAGEENKRHRIVTIGTNFFIIAEGLQNDKERAPAFQEIEYLNIDKLPLLFTSSLKIIYSEL